MWATLKWNNYCTIDNYSYWVVQSHQDHQHLQHDLNLIIQWTKRWQMRLNIDKCAVLTCSRSTSPPEFHYYIDNIILNCTNQHLYLGVLFHSTMSFSPHINNITSNSIKSLNFVRRNLNKCDESVKSAAYLGLVRPKLEYASAVWDPYLSKDIAAIERVQRIAARWITTGRIVYQTCSLSFGGQHYKLADTSQGLQYYIRVFIT